ncbi:MAG: ABC transporter permease [Candidatus Bathyarchaeota archaeon]|nr:MAG: ABC transporter permease [Candidatus Bathyarchaeota archaeon]
MKAQDVFSYALGAIRLRKLRAGLTTLGVVIGIAAIVALLSITQGLQMNINTQLQTGFATNTLIVSTGGGFGPGAFDGGTQSDFTLLVPYTAIIDELEGVSNTAAVIQKLCYLNSSEGEIVTTVIGVDFATYANIYSSTFVADRGEIPLDSFEDAIVVGIEVSEPWDRDTMFVDVNEVVDILWTNSSTFPFQNETYTGSVSAVLGEIGGFGIGPSDSRVYIPLTQAQDFFETDECNLIIVQLESDDQVLIESVATAIEDAFSGQVSVSSSTAILSTITTVFSTIEIFLGGIAAISLLVAGIGIMNIMIVSLMERTREIGILKALGMKSRTVLSIFLSESILIGLLGAIIGIASGWGLANVVAIVFSGGAGLMPARNTAAMNGGMTITPVLTPSVIIGAFIFGLTVSIVFALYPAWRASRLRPVEALRYE